MLKLRLMAAVGSRTYACQALEHVYVPSRTRRAVVMAMAYISPFNGYVTYSQRRRRHGTNTLSRERFTIYPLLTCIETRPSQSLLMSPDGQQ